MCVQRASHTRADSAQQRGQRGREDKAGGGKEGGECTRSMRPRFFASSRWATHLVH